jgi:hypothetical protein
MKCPYYRKVSPENHPFGLKSYCEGDPLTGLRVPSLFEETHYCTTMQYPACRVFHARQGCIEHTETPKTSQGRR